jgi:hypothetical protein
VTTVNLDVTGEEVAAARVANGLTGAVVAAIVSNVGIAAVAHRAGVAESLRPLQGAPVASITFAYVALGAVTWGMVRSLSHNAAGVLRWLVPTVVVLSAFACTALFSGYGIWAVLALLAMHLVTIIIVIPTLMWALPVRTEPTVSGR